jgi:hypothetical protein
MGNKKQKRAREEAAKRQAELDAQRRAARRAFEGNAALDLLASQDDFLIAGGDPKGKSAATPKPDSPPNARFREFGRVCLGFGAGAACNFFGSRTWILYIFLAGIVIFGSIETILSHRKTPLKILVIVLFFLFGFHFIITYT